MGHTIEIEDIEGMRLREGIYDAELREEIQALRVGDLVRLTLLTEGAAGAGETVVVRITHSRKKVFRGELVKRPTTPAFAKLRGGSLVAFTSAHIHSIPRGWAGT